MPRNLGSTTLKKRRANANPMHAYDTLPTPLRRWVSQASLPWSPRSCKRVWDKARKDGKSVHDALEILSLAEKKTLSKERALYVA